MLSSVKQTMVLQSYVLLLNGWDICCDRFCTVSYLAKTQVLLKYQATLEGVAIIPKVY